MYQGKIIFSKIMDYLPSYRFRQCVNKYNGNKSMRTFSCLDQYLRIAFAQITFRESLRDIECCLKSLQNKLYHMGINGKVSYCTLADSNKQPTVRSAR